MLEQAVLNQIMTDLYSTAFIKTLTREAIKYREAHREDPAKDLRIETKEIETRIAKMMELGAQMENPAPALREVDTLERRRSILVEEVMRLEKEYMAASLLDCITETHVQKFLVGIAENMDETDREAMKDFITPLVERITLDPASHECQINYRIGLDLRNKVASPRLRAEWPVLRRIEEVLVISKR